jgi:polysaccharide pyruvyl transferase WcaK-like protein
MSVGRECAKLLWSARSYLDFALSRAAVYGPFVTGNLGDDAALLAFTRAAGISPAVISAQTYRRIPANLTALYCGLGGCLNGDTPARFATYFSAVKKRRFPTMLISAGLNRDYDMPDDGRHDEAFKRFLGCFDYLSVRDLRTQALVERLGFGKVDLIPDMVLTLAGDYTVTPAARDRKTVAVILASHTGVVANRRKIVYPVLAQALKVLIPQGFSIAFIPFQNDTFSARRKAIVESEEAYRFANEYGIDAYHAPAMGPDATLAYLAKNVSHVITMRLHGAVFAARCALPHVTLSYNEKHEAFAEMLGSPESVISMWGDEFAADALLRRFDHFDREYAQTNGHLSARTAVLSERSRDALRTVSQKKGYERI